MGISLPKGRERKEELGRKNGTVFAMGEVNSRKREKRLDKKNEMLYRHTH